MTVTPPEPGHHHHPTIFDVAQRSGVSPTTVSHVLNGTRVVAHASRQRVLAAVEQLGYQPNAAARSLRSRRRRIVGLLVTNLQNRGFAALLEGIDLVMAQAGYSIIVSSSYGDPAGERAAVRMLREQRVDGLILAGSAGAADDMLLGLHQAGLPMVCINRTPTRLPLDQVSVDYQAAARLLARHLLDLGHRRFAILGGGASPDCHPLLDGWRQALAEAGATAPGGRAPAALEGDWSSSSGYELGRRLADEPALTAVFCGNDTMALGVIRALAERGLRVPEDISIIGFDDVPEAGYYRPPLTTVRQDFGEVGRQALSTLVDRMSGAIPAGSRVRVAPELIVRASAAGPPC